MTNTLRAIGSDDHHLATALDLLSIACSELVEHGLARALRPIILRLRSESDSARDASVGRMFRKLQLTLAVSVAESEGALQSVIDLSRRGMYLTWTDDPAFYNFCRSRLGAYAMLGDARRFSRIWSLALRTAVDWGDLNVQGRGLLEYAASRPDMLEWTIVARALSVVCETVGTTLPIVGEGVSDARKHLEDIIDAIRLRQPEMEEDDDGAH